MENLENRLQRVEKALKSMTAPVRRVFEEALASEKRKQLLELNNIPEGEFLRYHWVYSKNTNDCFK